MELLLSRAKATSSLFAIVLLGLMHLVQSVEFNPELVSTCGLPSTRITCVGQPADKDPFFEAARETTNSESLATLCAQMLNVVCGRVYDSEGTYHELLYLEAPYPKRARNRHPQAQWRYEVDQNRRSPFDFDMRTVFDLCFVKCRCADDATRRPALVNRRSLPDIDNQDAISPLIVAFDHVEDVYWQKVKPQPFLFGYDEGPSQELQRNLISHKINSPYMAAYWGNYLDPRDFPRSDAEQVEWKKKLDWNSGLVLLSYKMLQARRKYNREHQENPQVLFASGHPRNQPRCKPVPIPEEMINVLSSNQPVLSYLNATELCPHQLFGGNRTANFGGICLEKERNPRNRYLAFPDRTRHPYFTNDVAERTLERDALLASIETFCDFSCRCPTDPDYDEYDASHTAALRVGDEAAEGSSEGAEEQGSRKDIQGNLMKFANVQSNPPGVSNEELGTCTVMSRSCTRSGLGSECPKGCGCAVRSQTVNPARPENLLFTAACMSVVRHGGLSSQSSLWPRGVEEDQICPCNTTYVSRSCCGSEDGMVWEGRELKLGELKV